jgi:hypothetical protein
MKWATEERCAMVAPVLSAEIFASVKPQKAVKRFAQAIAFVAGDFDKGFEKSTALIVAALCLSSQKVINFGDMRFTMGGRGDDNTNLINGVSKSRLQRYIGAVGNGTNPTRVSSACGKNGFFDALGVTKKIGEHEFEIVSKESQFLLVYAAQLEKIGDQTFEILTREKK